MGKITLFVSKEEMLYQAHNILQEKKFQIQEMRVIETEHVVMEARRSILEGASIVIARGLQASLIKQYTDIPVVEIVLTAQEMGLLVTKAKRIAGKSRPVIAVVGFKNMFCDMTFFDELFGIELRTYYAGDGSGLPQAAFQAVEDGVDVLIGGDTAVSAATKAGRPSLFLSMTGDSMRQAFSVAESLCYAMNVEKKTAARMETILDYSYSGIIQLDGGLVVTAANSLMEEMTGRSQEELKGHDIREIAPMIGTEVFKQVFTEGKDYSLFLEWNGAPFFAVAAPVVIEGRVDGAIITCHEMKKKIAVQAKDGTDDKKKKTRHGAEFTGRFPLMRFEDVLQKSKAMQDCVRLANLYARSEQPVVLLGEPGTELRMLAESMHNGSGRSHGPFVEMPCEGLPGEAQQTMLYGSQGAVLKAKGGTLFLRDVEHLTMDNQYRLYRLIRFQDCGGNEKDHIEKVDVRVMVTVRDCLAHIKAQGGMRGELYYLLSGLELSIPPLREREEDLRQKLADALRDSCERYGRHHALSNGALKLLLAYPWYGNLIQIESFFERLILTAGKRMIDEIAVKKLLAELYSGLPEAGRADEGCKQKALGYAEEEAAKIFSALQKCGGRREKAAEELGISKTTLWRWMKKHGIEKAAIQNEAK